MNIFNDFFDNLIFTKVKIDTNYTQYVAVLESFINVGKQCVILLVPTQKANYEQAYIYQLDWSCLQTRIIDDYHYLNESVLDPKKLDTRYATQKILLKLQKRDNKGSEYTCPLLPIDVLLLNDPKKKTIYQYDDIIELRHALKTFNCIIKRNRNLSSIDL